ncbi:hypothetical protein TNCV_3653211 [Trichonephila clavipes]|nr:hypothetical protein TNCV_3653211 [Trichonephila clavipes]
MDGNEKADFLASTGAKERVNPTRSLTFSDFSSLRKIELSRLGRTPPWYFGRHPFKLMPWTVFSRFNEESGLFEEYPPKSHREPHRIHAERVSGGLSSSGEPHITLNNLCQF